jgi:hypothetical protein
MVGHCQEDSWLEDEGQSVFVLYGVHPLRGNAAQVGFVVDLRLQTVRMARLLVNVPDGIESRNVETLPLCPPLGLAYMGPGSETYRRVDPHVLEEHDDHVH